MIDEYRQILVEEIEENLKRIIESYRKEISQLKKERDELKVEVEHLKSKEGGEMNERKIVWHKYPKEKPKKDNPYLVSIKTGDDSFTSTSHWIASKDTFRDFWEDCISAWAEMPKPYKEEAW